MKIPAIGLIIAGTLNAATGALFILSGLIRLVRESGIISSGGDVLRGAPANSARQLGYYVGTFGIYAVACLSLILGPLIVYGAVRMLNGKKYKTAKRASILAIIPFTSCCFLLGIPLGIWALTLLNKPEIRAAFDADKPEQSNFPPPPPAF